MEGLLKISEKLDMIKSMVKEIENSKKEVENIIITESSSPQKDKIVRVFLKFLDEFQNPELEEVIKYLNEKIRDELKEICVHQWVEDDIEYNMDCEKHIIYCLKCNILKE